MDEKIPYKDPQKTRKLLQRSSAVVLTIILILFAVGQSLLRHLFQHPITIIGTAPLPRDEFRLKHIYHHNAGKNYMTHRRLDITPEFVQEQIEIMDSLGISASEPLELPHIFANQKAAWETPLNVSSSLQLTVRLLERDPDFMESYLAYARTAGSVEMAKINLEWQEDVISIPNVTDKETVVAFALMASNAYVEVPGTGDWRDVGKPWDEQYGVGWQGNGLRGHIFTNEDESIVVISLKGTSAQYVTVEGNTDTVLDDKINDNLLFSCCCARVSYMWTTVCDCYKSSYTCDQRCLEKELVREDRYYRAALDIYRNVTLLYPTASVYATGHSLGGALASLLGRTYGLPVIAFEAPGELLATRRLHLPMPPGLPSELEHIWHFGNTADPIFMGVCNGASSSCSLAGYAMETQCHTGRQCVYDVVSDNGWKVSLLNHRIHSVIDDIITQYNETAPCKKPPPCHDCFDWRFVDDKAVPTSTSTSSVPTGTSGTGDCLKRNWYGKCVEYGDGK